jgi:hypothetical protein
MFLLQKWPDAFSPDLAMSLSNQSDSVSELERREERRLVLWAREATLTFTRLFGSWHRQEAL